jgi:hypothetical protein
MSNRLIPFLLLAATLYALGASVSGLSRWQPASAGIMPASEAIPVLPTITVRPDEETAILLPTVTVRPGAAEIAAAKALDARALGSGVVVVAMHTLSGGLLPRTNLDMPYYSFGKSVYRVSKE